MDDRGILPVQRDGQAFAPGGVVAVLCGTLAGVVVGVCELEHRFAEFGFAETEDQVSPWEKDERERSGRLEYVQ